MKRLAALFVASALLSACSGHGSTPSDGGGGKTTQPGVGASSSPGGSFSQDAYTCPSSDGSSSTLRSNGSALAAIGRRAVLHSSASEAETPSLLAVTYDADALAGSRPQAVAREAALGADFVREYAFSHAGLITRVVHPPTGQLAAVEASLRAAPGVRSVSLTGYHRHLAAVTTPFFTNDPYFEGTGAVGPLYETTSSDGQWDMHVTRLEYAFGYSQTGNGSSVVNANALGAPGIRIAMIDTGADPHHPELSTQIKYQKCFITNPNGKQSTSDFETDPQGHGTATAGVAAAASDNGFGFTGSSGAATISSYRIFPTPDDNCASDTTTDEQCETDTQDITSAIEDAIAQKVNVISLSLGGSACDPAGTDPDSLEGNAIADALKANIIVVAAAGNDGTQGVESPACDSGVIAVGATSLSDGVANATGNTSGTAAAPHEYVASYSNYGSPAAAVQSTSAWGIVAPGGDPTDATDGDYLHWIDNIWTTTPYDANFDGYCGLDASGTADDCRTLIAGTSLATPNVAGAAALILAVNSAYQTPSKMKSLLCTTADNISAPHQGCGRLDIDRAMSVAVGDPSEPAGRPVP